MGEAPETLSAVLAEPATRLTAGSLSAAAGPLASLQDVEMMSTDLDVPLDSRTGVHKMVPARSSLESRVAQLEAEKNRMSATVAHSEQVRPIASKVLSENESVDFVEGSPIPWASLAMCPFVEAD